MNWDDDAVQHIYWDADLTFDPTGSTVELEVDEARRAMTWLDDPVVVKAGERWTQTARTEVRFCGSSVTAVAPDVQLTLGRHMAQPIITTADEQVVPGPEIPIDVK